MVYISIPTLGVGSEHTTGPNILPGLQVATQQGVLMGDLTMFLNEFHTAATVYCIKRDHTKGFDNLDASAYLDALEFYGVNPAVAVFERARTKDVTLYVKTADGILPRAIVTNGQTKQGDPPSPIKYTITMSMLHKWMTHWRVLRHDDVAQIRTVMGHRGTPHTPTDAVKAEVLSVEAMDDSIMFATSWDALRRIVTLSEDFQGAYGIQTAWDSCHGGRGIGLLHGGQVCIMYNARAKGIQ